MAPSRFSTWSTTTAKTAAWQVQYNVNDSIRGFARACFNYGLMRRTGVLVHQEHDF